MPIKLQGTNSAAAPGLTNDGGDGVVVGTDSVDISIGGVSKVNVDSSGNTTVSGNTTSGKLTISHDDWDSLRVVNTNTNTYGAYIDLVKDSSSMADGDQSGVIRFRGDDDAGNEHTYGYMLGKCTDVSNGAEDGQIEFHTSSGGTVAERLRITQSGNLKILDGDLQINTAGHGIDFSATADGSGASSVSELFSDYEEGTFSPTMSAGYTSPGYHSDTGGWYTKIGNTVYARIYMRLNAGTPNSDQVAIAGLPFTHAGAFYAAAQGYIPTGDVGAAVHPLLVLMPSTTNLKLYVQNQTSVGTRSGSSLNANAELIYWITYKVA